LFSNVLFLTRSIDLLSGPVIKTKKVSSPVVNKKKGKGKDKDTEMPVQKKFGWFGSSTEHHYVEDAEEVLDGLE
jgi:hypothetical protein